MLRNQPKHAFDAYLREKYFAKEPIKKPAILNA